MCTVALPVYFIIINLLDYCSPRFNARFWTWDEIYFILFRARERIHEKGNGNMRFVPFTICHIDSALSITTTVPTVFCKKHLFQPPPLGSRYITLELHWTWCRLCYCMWFIPFTNCLLNLISLSLVRFISSQFVTLSMFFVPFTICHIDSPLSIATTVPILYFLQKYLLWPPPEAGTSQLSNIELDVFCNIYNLSHWFTFVH